MTHTDTTVALPSEKISPPAGTSTWEDLLSRESAHRLRAKETAKTGQRVLVGTSVGGGTATAMSVIESLLAVALTLRGADVHVLLCDQALPACKNLEMVTVGDP